MKRSFYWIIAIACLQGLTACQYFTFYKKISDPEWANADTAPDSDCEAMGASRNTAALDWCVAREESDRER